MKGYSSKQFSIRRRYNDFLQLYKTLNELIKTKKTRATLPPFPPKTAFRPESTYVHNKKKNKQTNNKKNLKKNRKIFRLMDQ